MYTKQPGYQELDIRAYDHWSMDARQDSWFTASSLHAVIESLENKPKWVTIISDNGPHYHNADLMMILGNWLEWYQINVKKSIKTSRVMLLCFIIISHAPKWFCLLLLPALFHLMLMLHFLNYKILVLN